MLVRDMVKAENLESIAVRGLANRWTSIGWKSLATS